MRRKPAVYSDTFGGDLANALLLRPVYRKPKTSTRTGQHVITTLEELEALPAGSVFRDDFGRLWEWEHVGFGGIEKALSAMGIGSMLAAHGFEGFPVTVLHVPGSDT